MAEIYVKSSGDLQGVIDRLRQLNADFRTKASDIRNEQSNLTTKWEGDASTAFQENFRKEEPNFESFATAIDEYIAGLERILAQYESAEERNKATAMD